MNLFIKNETIIKYKKIGELFDEYYKKNKRNLYVDNNDVIVFREKKKDYKFEIKCKKTKINLNVEELDLEPRKIDLRKIKFPKLPIEYE